MADMTDLPPEPPGPPWEPSEPSPTLPSPTPPPPTLPGLPPPPSGPGSPPPSDPASPPPPERRRPGRLRHVLLGALVGGVCGALVASGAFVFFDDDDNDGPATVTATRSPELTRESSRIATEGDVAAIIAAVQPAVVSISANVGGGGEGAGTGFAVGTDGVIVTNAHVVADADDIEVTFSDGSTQPADIVGRDVNADLAVLKVDATGLPVVQLGSSDDVQIGDDVVAIGNALALEGGLTVTRGIISGPPRPEVAEELGIVLESVIQTDASISSGNSGGPLVDAQGRVIGINTAIAGSGPGSQAENVGFAIPISLAAPIIDDLAAGRLPAFLGVATDTLTPELGDELGVDADGGAVVVNVTEDSPAEDAGIETQDVIVEIGGDPIGEAGDVPDAIRRHRPGDTVEVVLLRDSERVTVDATLVERPDSS
jgi:serine protease Do